MAGRGPAPKAQHQRERDTRRRVTSQSTTVVDDGTERGPSLEDLTGRGTWSDDVRRWYATWRTSAQAAVFTSTDWQRLGMLAYLVESFYRKPSKGTFEEIRLNEERLGATLVDRQRARLVVEPARSAETPAGVVSMADRRAEMQARLRGDDA